jgi:hypothetical protein
VLKLLRAFGTFLETHACLPWLPAACLPAGRAGKAGREFAPIYRGEFHLRSFFFLEHREILPTLCGCLNPEKNDADRRKNVSISSISFYISFSGHHKMLR